jgi:hypothetical protein
MTQEIKSRSPLETGSALHSFATPPYGFAIPAKLPSESTQDLLQSSDIASNHRLARIGPGLHLSDFLAPGPAPHRIDRGGRSFLAHQVNAFQDLVGTSFTVAIGDFLLRRFGHGNDLHPKISASRLKQSRCQPSLWIGRKFSLLFAGLISVRKYIRGAKASISISRPKSGDSTHQSRHGFPLLSAIDGDKEGEFRK